MFHLDVFKSLKFKQKAAKMTKINTVLGWQTKTENSGDSNIGMECWPTRIALGFYCRFDCNRFSKRRTKKKPFGETKGLMNE